jgi:hypothetical protein
MIAEKSHIPNSASAILNRQTSLQPGSPDGSIAAA